ncbi:hypothetical protein HPB52_001441 [Rhipicephalus sanguineus]|uniref:Alanine--tRNA ligase n=1 Tax=Rhipicephalus sanguineus TaxID=34632 RepID=A0A9D4QGZ5_RHISA|nr:hypothetical protein HPB52_001441 [Rhipicephalus sanguineus]
MIYFTSNLECVYGGDYDGYATAIRNYFAVFKACNIELILVFDGGHDVSNRKLKTTQRRLQERLATAKAIAKTGAPNLKILPILAHEVFKDVVRELGIQVFQCSFEADEEIAAIANHYGCPVASQDSDFYIFNLVGGFIRLDSICTSPQIVTAENGENFKPIFLGTVDPNSEAGRYKRVVDTQKCIRAGGKHNDLDDVGKDVYHHTFFEMLGNWSFGDFFKKEICAWAWELLTEVFKLQPDRLYVTYFGGNEAAGLKPDLECKEIWKKLGVPEDRILPGSMKDNFWEMGETGPCGPCSEIHYDRIGGRNVAHLVNADVPDVLEIWNLVFIQYNRETDGTLRLLPKQHVDTGMGFERLVSVIQDKPSNYDTDIFVPIFEAIQKATGVRPYSGKVGKDDVDGIDMAYRVLADHSRTLTIALSDGGRPDNIGRGYVLRRILRRAVRYATEKMNAAPGTFARLVPVVVEILGDAFPELKKDPEGLASQGGDNKVDAGLKLDVHAISELQAKGVPSTDDLPKYDYSAKSEDKNAAYEFAPCYGTVLVLRTSKTFVDSVEAGHQCGVILDRTNFYAESGGQSCDTGFMTSEENEDVEFAVNEVHVQGGYVIHIGRLGSGTLKVGDKLKLSIDEERRKLLMNNHTGTHVLNFALRQVLTAEADQRGSLVAPDRLRFDFANKVILHLYEQWCPKLELCGMFPAPKIAFSACSQLNVGLKIWYNGASFFFQTYPDPVRVVSIGIPVEELLADPSSPAGSVTSVEFCGGTHLKRAGHVGDFVISTEEAIAKGIRRIVALTGPEATKAVKKAEHYQSEVNRLRTEVDKVTQAAQGKELVKQIVELTEEISQSSISYWKKDELRTDLKNLKKKLDDLDRSNKAQAQQLAIETVKKLLEDKKDCDYIVHTLEVGDNAKALDAALKQVRTLTPNAAAMFLSQDNEKGKVICLSTVPKGIVARGLTANAWVKEVSEVIGGKGGGREESAQAIGNNVGSIEKALQVANEFAKLKLAC